MTNGQTQQLQDLTKCYLVTKGHKNFVEYWTVWAKDEPLNWSAKKVLRRLTHLYRNQIKAIKKNQETYGT